MGHEVTDDFRDEMTRMMDLKAPPASLDGHWDALKDIPIRMLRAAITHALKTRPWFPTPAELRADVNLVAPQFLEPESRTREVEFDEPVVIGHLPTGRPVKATREWRYDCDVCRDDGWAERHCDPEHGQSCGRPHAHDPHTYVVRCPCIATNPTIQRKKAAQAKYAAAPEKASA